MTELFQSGDPKVDRALAENTLKFEIRNAIAGTARVTGVRAGDASEVLVEAVFAAVTAGTMNWAFEILRQRGEGAK